MPVFESDLMSGSPPLINWPLLAQKLGERTRESNLDRSVLAEMERTSDRSILVACSGGADSVFLLCWLYAQSGARGLKLSVAHYNHRWRGARSAKDAAFVRAAADSLGLPYSEAQRPEKEAAFTETAARALRLNFLRATAREQGCSSIAYGHQMDDILETQLQRLARGSGSEGLAAPRPVAVFPGEPTHLRPLLGLRAGDIRMVLRSLAIPWCEDDSNADTTISRNALRSDVVPAMLEALDRDPSVGAARSRRLLEEDAAALDQLARKAAPDAFAGCRQLARSSLQALPVALLRRVLSAWLGAHGLNQHFGAAALDRLIEQCREGFAADRHSAGPVFIRLTPEALSIEPEPVGEAQSLLQPTEFEPGETIFLPEGFSLQSRECAVTRELLEEVLSGKPDPWREAVLALPVDRPLELRGCQPGDRFTPLGAPGSRKLKDWLIDHGVPRKERKRLPLVTTSTGEILWLPGAPPAERFKLTASTKQALRLTYRSGNPV